MGGVGHGPPTEHVYGGFYGFCAPGPVGAICRKGIQTVLHAGGGCGCGRSRGSGCGLGGGCGARWRGAWGKLRAQRDERGLLDWEEAFLDATFVTAKKGASGSARHVVGKVRSAWWWSTAAAYLSERNLRPRKSPNTGLRKARSNR